MIYASFLVPHVDPGFRLAAIIASPDYLATIQVGNRAGAVIERSAVTAVSLQ